MIAGLNFASWLRGRDRRRKSDEGGAALIEFCTIGLMLMVPLLYMMIAVFELQAAMYGVSAAARDASRAFSLAQSVPEGQARADQAATAALAAQNLGLGQMDSYDVRCTDGPCLSSGSFAEVEIRYTVPFPLLPEFFNQPGIEVWSVHRTPVGEFREDR